MNVSVCLTVFNEERSIAKLIASLLSQSKKPDEIIIVDGGSFDRTKAIIRHLQKKDKRIKLLVQKCTRAEGRNLSVELAKNEIIAMTDAGCTADKYWLERITEPFKHKKVGIAAGFYKMVARNPKQEAMSVFLGVLPSQFDMSFLPSTRSMAFRKTVFEKLGGFPENLRDTAEDTVFNNNAVKMGIYIARVKSAVVEWGMPKTLGEFARKIYLYARGDAKSGIWKHAQKGKTSHNIKALLIFLRYTAGLVLLFLSFSIPPLFWVLAVLILFYFSYSFKKVFTYFRNISTGFWGIVMQVVSDLSVMRGFIRGFLG